MNQKTKGDIFRIGSYTLLIACFAGAFIYLLVYGQSNAEKLEFARLRTEYSQDQSAILKTSEGDITIALNNDNAPITVYSFVALSQNGFYDDSVFGNAVVGFYAEGGKQTKKTSTSSTSIVAKHIGQTYLEVNSDTPPPQGSVLLVNSGPGKKDYHFLIVTTDNVVLLENLKGKFPIVGMVTSGMDVVERIEKLHHDKESVTIEGVRVQ